MLDVLQSAGSAFFMMLQIVVRLFGLKRQSYHSIYIILFKHC